MKSLKDCSDDDLRKLAASSVTTVDRIGESAKRGGMGVLSSSEAAATLLQLKNLRDEARGASEELTSTVQTIQSLRDQLARAEADLAEKTAALRLVDPTTVQRRIDDARAAGRAEAAASSEVELTALRAEVAQQRSWIEELRANKKKLRETIDRMKERR